MKTDFLRSDSLSGLWIDALVKNGKDKLLFLSAWGSETAIQQTRARFSLPVSESGLRGFKIHRGLPHWTSDRITVENPERYEQLTGRPSGQPRFRHLTQLWMFPRLAEMPDGANNRALLFRRPEEKADAWQQRLWQTVQTICPVPLHPSWDSLVSVFMQCGWIREYRGFHVDAWYLKLPEKEVQPLITTAVQQGRLQLPITH